MLETLRLHLSHDDITKYNGVQKIMYLVAILAGVTQVITGVAIWKPVQFAWLTALFGGFQGARLVHFIGMAVHGRLLRRACHPGHPGAEDHLGDVDRRPEGHGEAIGAADRTSPA